MKIAIFGGSFNPVHKGHVNIMQTAIEELELDKLYVVPAFKNPFKKKHNYQSVEHRIKMLEMVIPEKVEISLFEVKRKTTSYTIDTVNYFKKKFPNDEIFLIIGSDNVNKLNKWKNIKEISEMVNITVFKREGEFSKVNIKKFNCALLQNTFFPENSTSVRHGVFKHLDKKVHQYIADNTLYLEDIAKNALSINRYKHSEATGSLAAELAKKHASDAKQAWIAGFMHDITKEWDEKKSRDFLHEMGYEAKESPFSILHQWTGSLWLQNHYGLKDKEIINSIFRHTTADSLEFESLTKLDKIVYIADKLCPGRKYEGINKHRKLAFEDLDKCFKAVAEERQKRYKDDVGIKYVLNERYK